MQRDQLLRALQDGRVDMVVAQMTVTPERRALVDFTNPTRKDVSEVVVTARDAPPLTTIDDLSDRPVFVRRSSSYYTSLLAWNERLATSSFSTIPGNCADSSS